MKKTHFGFLGLFLFSAALNADAYHEPDKLIGGKDFPFPSDDEATLPEMDETMNDVKPSGKSEKEYVPDVENDDDAQ